MATAAANDALHIAVEHTPSPDLQGSSSLLRPIIKQLLTSDVREEGVVLLVDKVNITSFQRHGELKETCRLWLSDGLMSIQCLLKQDVHHLLASGDIQQGALLSVDDYQVMQRPKINGEGTVWVLLASQVQVIASQDRGSPEFDVEHWDVPKRSPGKFFREYGRAAKEEKQPSPKPRDGPELEPVSHESDDEGVDLIPTPEPVEAPQTKVASAGKRKAKDFSGSQPLSPLDPNSHNRMGRRRKRARLWDLSPQKTLAAQSEELYAAFRALQPSPNKKSAEEERPGSSSNRNTPLSTKPTPESVQQSPAKGSPWVSPSPRSRIGSQQQASPNKNKALKSPSPKVESKGQQRTKSPKRDQSPSKEQTQQQQQQQQQQQIPPVRRPAPPLRPITRPLKITPLSNVTGRFASRNKIFDFLVVVTHVNPRLLVRRHLPDSRELLVMDRSTEKQVHLTVFVDAENFRPEQGTVALLRNITTHEYGGGSLKAYYQRCVNTQWYTPETTPGWSWPAEADALRDFWLACPAASTVPEGTWWTEKGQAAKLRQGDGNTNNSNG